MNYDYEDIIDGINQGKINSVLFSIRDYTHYKNCFIKRCVDAISTEKQITRIEVKLVDDDSETISFYKKFKEDYKLFKFGRKGTFTLKQVWEKIEILEIIYNDFHNYSIENH